MFHPEMTKLQGHLFIQKLYDSKKSASCSLQPDDLPDVVENYSFIIVTRIEWLMRVFGIAMKSYKTARFESIASFVAE